MNFEKFEKIMKKAKKGGTTVLQNQNGTFLSVKESGEYHAKVLCFEAIDADEKIVDIKNVHAWAMCYTNDWQQPFLLLLSKDPENGFAEKIYSISGKYETIKLKKIYCSVTTEEVSFTFLYDYEKSAIPYVCEDVWDEQISVNKLYGTDENKPLNKSQALIKLICES